MAARKTPPSVSWTPALGNEMLKCAKYEPSFNDIAHQCGVKPRTLGEWLYADYDPVKNAPLLEWRKRMFKARNRYGRIALRGMARNERYRDLHDAWDKRSSREYNAAREAIDPQEVLDSLGFDIEVRRRNND